MLTRKSGYREAVARLVTGAAIAIALATASAGAAADSQAHVSPVSGAPTTTFTVSFVVPARTGVTRSIRVRDEVTASNPSTASGCDPSASQPAPAAERGRLVHVALRPARGSRWCRGTFTGKVLELQTPVCPPRSLCPMYERLRTLGAFTFSVGSR
jgi:hypothetical protein